MRLRLENNSGRRGRLSGVAIAGLLADGRRWLRG